MITVVHAQPSEPSARSKDNFTGEVWRDLLLPPQDGFSIGNVFFAPGSRSYWHTHAGGQILIIVAGQGFVGHDEGVERVVAGDTIWTPPGVRHWHGAAPDQYMVHTAVTLAGVEWLEAVSDTDYHL